MNKEPGFRFDAGLASLGFNIFNIFPLFFIFTSLNELFFIIIYGLCSFGLAIEGIILIIGAARENEKIIKTGILYGFFSCVLLIIISIYGYEWYQIKIDEFSTQFLLGITSPFIILNLYTFILFPNLESYKLGSGCLSFNLFFIIFGFIASLIIYKYRNKYKYR